MPKKQKVAFVANSSWYIYNLRIGVIRALQDQGIQITTIAPVDDYTLNLINEGCEFIPIQVNNRGVNPFEDIQLYRTLKKIYLNCQFDYIFHYTVKLNIFGTLAAAKTKLKSIAVISGTGHTFINRNLLFRVTKNLYKIALKKAEEIWFVNQDDKDLFFEEGLLSHEKYQVLPGEGINTKYFYPAKERNTSGKLNFLFSGRLMWSKGLGEYIEAAKIIKEKYPDTHFQILGFFNVPNPTALSKKEILKLHLEGIIEYLGSTSDVRPFLKKTDCFVFPSYYGEGTPRSLLEAASMQIPIITTDNVGCREVVDHGYNGFLCQAKDVPDLVVQIEKMINMEKEQRVLMGQNGRKKVIKEFSEDFIIRRYFKTLALENILKKEVIYMFPKTGSSQ